MRLNNRTGMGVYVFSLTMLAAIIISCGAALMLKVLHYQILPNWAGIVFIAFAAVLTIIFYLRGRQFFQFDSDGETLHLKNSWILPLGKVQNDEFPKYKLQSFEVIDGLILKKLYLTVWSKKDHPIVLKYDISYLKKKELQDLKNSLHKVIKTNQENRETRS